MKNTKKIILASGSPRRKMLLNALLKKFGLKFVVIPANIEEYIPAKINDFGKFTADLAELKALEVAQNNNGLIIAADTIVVYKNKVLGKPGSKSEAKKMLNFLSGKKHNVFTGICIVDTEKNQYIKTYEKTEVSFRKLQNKEIEFYVNSGSPMDKAGSYGIQDDLGSTFVKSIKGDYFNVVGLPVLKLYLNMSKFIKFI